MNKYYCTKCKTEIKEIQQPIVVCQECLLVQLVPYKYRPVREQYFKNYETRGIPNDAA
jgi:hypothetical protein